MASTEVKGLPLGNEWEFSERNYTLELQPGTGIEITQPSNQLQELIRHVQSRFIREEWMFTSIVGAFPKINEGSPELFVIFTHPVRVTLEETWGYEIGQFIRSEIIEASDSTDRENFHGRVPPADDPINRILKGTDLVVSNIGGRYNLIVDKGGRIFRQTGVGYFDIDLGTVDKNISEIDQELKEFMIKVRPLQKEREILLALKSPNPVRLFN